MSLQEALLVKGRFNGRFSGSLSRTLLSNRNNQVLTDCRVQTKSWGQKKYHVLLSIVSHPHGFKFWTLWFCAAVRIASQKVCQGQMEAFISDSWLFRDKRFSPSGITVSMLLLIRATAHLCVLSKETPRQPSRRLIRLRGIGLTGCCWKLLRMVRCVLEAFYKRRMIQHPIRIKQEMIAFP